MTTPSNKSQNLSKADYVTLTAIFLAFISLGLLVTETTRNIACALAIFAMLLDFLDGKIARKFGSSTYGKQLDTLFDIVGFVVFPALLVITNSTAPSLTNILVASFFGVAAAFRLARFTTEGFLDSKLAYKGMPVLYSIFAVVLIPFVDGYASLAVLLLMTPLMVTKIPFSKPKHPLFGLIMITASLLFLYYGI